MDSLYAILLGAVQVVTEFLPISSTGHLILVRDVLHIQAVDGLAFDAVLQLASALAVIVYFRKDITRLLRCAFSLCTGRALVAPADRTMIVGIIAGTIPVVIAGLLLESHMETVFRGALPVVAGLLFGSIVMWVAEKISKKRLVSRLSISRSFGIGLFQALALVPGISRSGATISGGIMLGLSREDAARFSFLLSVPIIVGSGGKELISMLSATSITSSLTPLFAGFLASLIVSFLAIRFLISYLRANSLLPFVWYRLALAGLIIIFLV